MAGFTRSPDIVIEPPVLEDKSPFGPLSTSAFIGILVAALFAILLVLVLICTVPSVYKRLQTSDKTKGTLVVNVDHFDHEVQAIVSYNNVKTIFIM